MSIKTASRALGGEGYVAPATAARVQDAARTVGFRLNVIASESRRGGRSTLVGLVTGDLANPFYSRVAGGIERELRSRGLQLVTASTDEDPAAEHALIDALLQRRVQALLIASASADHTHLAEEVGRGVPLVFVDWPPVGILADAVLIDNRAGASSAIEHLVAAGHRQIAVIADLSRWPPNKHGSDSVADAMAAAGIDDWQRWFRRCPRCGGRRGCRRPPADQAGSADRTVHPEQSDHRRRAARPATCPAAGPDRRQGRRPRADHRARPPALIGFDDFELSDLLGVSVVGYDTEEMGRTAAKLALDRLDGADISGDRGDRHRT